jgi:hypothetical protein
MTTPGSASPPSPGWSSPAPRYGRYSWPRSAALTDLDGLPVTDHTRRLLSTAVQIGSAAATTPAPSWLAITGGCTCSAFAATSPPSPAATPSPSAGSAANAAPGGNATPPPTGPTSTTRTPTRPHWSSPERGSSSGSAGSPPATPPLPPPPPPAPESTASTHDPLTKITTTSEGHSMTTPGRHLRYEPAAVQAWLDRHLPTARQGA